MKIRELRALSIEELEAKLSSFQEEQMRMRCNHATAQLGNTALIRQGRQQIARVKTLIREKQLASA